MIIPANDLTPNSTWQAELANAKTEVQALLDYLQLSADQAQRFLSDHNIPTNFPLRVTQSYAQLMEKGNPHDPLLLQIMPGREELIDTAGFSTDPLSEQGFNPTPGVIHKYQGRALLTVTQACAIHCRYCFRRHFDYQANTGASALEGAFRYLRGEPDIRELILSGGDPLSVSDNYLGRIIKLANETTQLKRLRFHTRLPVVLPTRINSSLIEHLNQWRGQLIIVIHCNHPAEISPAAATALEQLNTAGATLLNQSVLLKGVNDNQQTLADLSEVLFDAGVMPYYLHQLDPVAGAQHFAVADDTAKRLIKQVSSLLPGYLVPKLVREIPGRDAKTLL